VPHGETGERHSSFCKRAAVGQPPDVVASLEAGAGPPKGSVMARAHDGASRLVQMLASPTQSVSWEDESGTGSTRNEGFTREHSFLTIRLAFSEFVGT
jgi:hypothetical protein